MKKNKKPYYCKWCKTHYNREEFMKDNKGNIKCPGCNGLYEENRRY